MQHDRAALIVAHDVERVLTDIDADYGDCGIELLRHGVLLVFGAPGQHEMLVGQEHGRTIPLADIERCLTDVRTCPCENLPHQCLDGFGPILAGQI